MGVNRNWTQQEKQFLQENWGIKSIPSIAKYLDRPAGGIVNMAHKLSLGPALMGGEYITLNQLMIAVTGSAVDAYHKISWIQNRGMPVRYKTVNNNRFRVVYLDDFWKWAEKNRSFIDFSKMEPLILGEEPPWVEEQRKKDIVSFSLQRKDPWTPAEDKRLLDLLKQQKYGYMELSQILKRSAGAIQRRCTDLGTKYRPVKADNHGDAATWDDADFKILADGIRQGDSYTAIGNRLGKSEKAVRGKVYFVYLTENADKVRSMLQNREWGYGAPVPTVRQAIHLSRCRTATKKDLATLAGVLKIYMNRQGYDPYWQRHMCMHWDNLDGCGAGCDNCDDCTEFMRIREQFCARCGKGFFEREKNTFCKACRSARKKQAAKKWAILHKKQKREESDES